MDFLGVEELIDAVGGIDIDVPEELAFDDWWYSDEGNRPPHWLSVFPGEQHMSGYTAVAFGRYRNGPDGDLGTADDVRDPASPIERFAIPGSVLSALSGLGLPATVNGLLELANRGLANQPTGGANLNHISQAADAVNRGGGGRLRAR